MRFTMLESLRAYGLERLADEGELDAARADHLAWCVELAAAGPATACGVRISSSGCAGWTTSTTTCGRPRPRRGPRSRVGACASPATSSCRGGSAAGARRSGSGREAALAAAGDRPSAARARVLAMAGLVAEPGIRSGANAATDLRDELLVAEHRQREALAFDEAG